MRGPPTPQTTRTPLAVTAWALMANTVTTSALGVVFWAVASRIYSTRELGENAGLVSAMILLSTVSQLNLGMGIPRLLPQVQDRRWRPVLGAYAVTAALGIVVTAAFVVLVPRFSGGFSFLADEPALGLALAGAVVLWNIFALQDAVLTSARWATAIPFENGLFGLLKIALMIGLAGSFRSHGVFFAWLIGMAVLLVPMNCLVFWKVLPSRQGRQSGQPQTVLPLGERGRVTRYLLTDYAAALLSQGSTALLPLLVIGALGRADNAYFYVAFLITAAVAALAQALSTSLVVEGAHDESDLPSLARRSIVRYLKVVVPAVVFLMVTAPLLLWPFGAAYVDNGTTLLRLLLAGTLPQAVVTMYLGVERVRAQVRRVLVVEAVTVVLVIAGALLGMRWQGLTGLGLTWLVAQLSVAAVIVPRLWRVVSGARTDGAAKDEKEHDMTANGHRPARPAVAPPAPPVPSPAFPSGRDLADVGAAAVTVALLVVAGLGVTGWARIALALAFVSFVPGWAVLGHVRMAENASRVALAVALSLSLGTVAALSSLWLQVWHPRALLDVTAALCLMALAWHLARPRQTPIPALVESRAPATRTPR